MTEFRYDDEVKWSAPDLMSDQWVRAVVVDERRWGGGLAGTFEGEYESAGNFPVFISVAGETHPRWVSGWELSLIRPRVDED